MKKIIIIFLTSILVITKSQSQVNLTQTGTNSVTSTSAINANTFIGFNIGYAPSGSSYYNRYNTLIGNTANGSTIPMITPDGCTYVGYNAGYYNLTSATTPTSVNNTYIGARCGFTQNGVGMGQYNSFIGYGAGQYYSGSNNTLIGYLCAQHINGTDNTAIGQSITLTGPSNYTSDHGAYIGSKINIGDGSYENVGIGYNATIGTNVTYSTTIGVNTKLNNSVSYSTAIGFNSSVGASLSYATSIGSGATVSTSNSIVLGRVSTVDNVGIGTSSPAARLHVDALNSNIRFDNLTASTSPVSFLVLDANNNVKTSSAVLGAENGNSLDANNKITLGQDACPTGSSNPALMTSDRFIPLNNHNVYFADGGSG